MAVAITGAAPGTLSLLSFRVDDRRCALELAQVERVLRMVALLELPKAPAVILGVFRYRGEILPVASVRRRLRLPHAEALAEEQLIVVQTSTRRLALAVDHVDGVESVELARMTTARDLVPGLEFVRGIVQLGDDGPVLLHDVDTFLSLDEHQQTLAAVREHQP